MLELLVLKNLTQRTSQRVKWTSGARVMTISFQELPGPMFLKQPDFNIVFFIPQQPNHRVAIGRAT